MLLKTLILQCSGSFSLNSQITIGITAVSEERSVLETEHCHLLLEVVFFPNLLDITSHQRNLSTTYQLVWTWSFQNLDRHYCQVLKQPLLGAGDLTFRKVTRCSTTLGLLHKLETTVPTVALRHNPTSLLHLQRGNKAYRHQTQ